MKSSRNKKIIVIVLFIALSFGVVNSVSAQNTKEEYTTKFNAVWKREFPDSPPPSQAVIDKEYQGYSEWYQQVAGSGQTRSVSEQQGDLITTQVKDVGSPAAGSEFGAPGPGGESGAGVASPEAGAAARSGQAVPTLDAAKPPPQSGGGSPVKTPVVQTGEEITKELGWLGAIIVNVASVVLSLVAGLVDWAVRFGNDVLTLDAVQTGWKIVLNFVNLGFVLAIIVIAFATIFQLQSYAMKQTLWKLIAAALLVNFSLVIAGAFISVSDNLSNVFLKPALGENGTNLSYALAGAFQPQKLAQVRDMSIWEKFVGVFTGETLKWLLSMLAGLFFVVVFTFLMILAFFSLFVMLLIRAIALIFLLVLSPAAWLFWIFPYTQQYWQKWWKEFLRWNFFAPVVMFFIYLTILTAGGLRGAKPLESITAAESTYNSAAAAFKNTTIIGPEGGFFRYVAELLVLLALLFGGIYVANQFGIAGGGLAYGWATGVGKMFSGWVGRKGIQVGTAPVRWSPIRKGLEKLENVGAGGNWVQRRLGALVRQPAARLSRLGGIGAEQQVEEAKKRLPADDWRLAKMIHTLDAPAQVAALQRLRQNKTLDLIEDITPFISDEMREKFVKYGQPSPDYSALLRTAGLNPEMLKIMKAKATGQKGFIRKVKQPDGKIKDVEYENIDKAMEDASADFMRDYRPEHFSNMEVDEIFGKKEEFGLGNIKFPDGTSAHRYRARNVARGILETNPDGIANAFRRIKGGNRVDFMGDLGGEIQKIWATGGRQEKYQGDIWAMLDAEYSSLAKFLDSSAATNLGIVIPGLPEREGDRRERRRRSRSGTQDAGTWVS